jgi:enoyl-CoA hydratase
MIEYEERGSLVLLRMVRGKGNALNLDLLEALNTSLEGLAQGPARSGIITGQGNVFGAGVDLVALLDGGAAYVRRFLPLLTRTFQRLAAFPKPLVAAVNGHAIAGGAMLMLACDQRLLARGTARIGLTEIKVGVPFPAWALEIARWATPPQHLSTLIVTGRTWLPEDALARGLVDELVDPARLLDRALEVAEELAAVPPALFAATKLALRRPMLEAAEREAALTDGAILEQWCAPETLQQVAEFARKTIKGKE